MDQELIAYLDKRFGDIDKRFGETEQQIQGLRQEMKESIRHTQILVEGARGEIRIVAEGFVGQSESLDGFRKEMKQELNDIRQLIRPAYSALDQRLRNLEVHLDLKTIDPIKYIKERILGRPPE